MAYYEPSGSILAIIDGTGPDSAQFNNNLDRLISERSGSTNQQRNSAINMFNLIQAAMGKAKFDDLSVDDDLSGEKKYILLGDYAFSLVDIGLKKSTGKNYQSGGLLNYFGKLHNLILRKCAAEGDNYKNDETFKAMKASLDDRLRKRDLKGRIDLDLNETMPLYKKLSPLLSHFDQGVDLTSIAKMLLTCRRDGVHSATFRLKLCLNYQACGRTGEWFSLNYKDWKWDQYLQSTLVGWPEFKTLRKYVLSIGTDIDSFVLSPYHAFGCAAIVDGFLVRSATMKEEKAMYVFSHDYLKLTRKTSTNAFNNSLKECCPKKIRKMISGKSIRQAVITILSLHPLITFYLLLSRSGHAIPDNSGKYVVPTIASLIPSQNIITGENFEQLPTAPTMQCVLGQGQIDLFIHYLFPVSPVLKVFKPGERLRPFLEVCAAELVRSYEEMKSSFAVGGSRTVLNKMIHAVLKSNLAADPHSAERLLIKWGAEIEHDFQNRRREKELEALQKTSYGRFALRLCDKIDSLQRIMLRMEKKIDILEENRRTRQSNKKRPRPDADEDNEYQDRPTVTPSSPERVITQGLRLRANQNESVEDATNVTRNGRRPRVIFKQAANPYRKQQQQAPRPPSVPNYQLQLTNEPPQPPPTVQNQLNPPPPTVQNQQFTNAPPPTAQNKLNSPLPKHHSTFMTMMNSANTQEASRNVSGTVKNFFLSSMLKDFNLRARGKSILPTQLKLPIFVTDKKKYQRGVEAVQTIMSKRELNVLRSKTSDEAKVLSTALEIEERMQEVITTLRFQYTNKRSRSDRPTPSAIGNLMMTLTSGPSYRFFFN